MNVAEQLKKKNLTPEEQAALKARLEQHALDRALQDERAKRHAKRVVDAEEQPAQAPLQALTIEELFASPVPQYVIDRMIPDVGFVQVVGEPGTLKSFFMCHVGLCIASGQTQCFGFPVLRHGPVLYIAAEGAGAFQFRIRAWCHEHYINPLKIPFYIIRRPVNLRDPATQVQLLATVAELQPIVIITDTLARCTPGADENSTRDMGEVVAFCSELQRQRPCAIVVVHHPTKSDPTGGGRGSGAIFGAIDTEIRLSKEDEDAMGVPITVKCAKQKDDSAFPDFNLLGCIVPVHDEFGREMAHESGRAITSIVLRVVDTSGEAAEAMQRKRAQEHAFDLKVLGVMRDYPAATNQHKIREYLGVQLQAVTASISRILQEKWAERGKRAAPFIVTELGRSLLEVPF